MDEDSSRIAREIRDEFEQLYRSDPGFRARFNSYLRELGMLVIPMNTLAELGTTQTKH